MRQITLDQKYVCFLADQTSHNVVVYVHSLSQDFQTEFAQHIINSIVSRLGFSVLAFHFDFLRRATAPSMNLQDEIIQLEQAVDYARKVMGAKRISIVGKSLGGVVGLALAAQKRKCVEQIICLGWPITLGFPPRFEILKGKDIGPFNFHDEYEGILQKIQTPIHVIQGGSDDLGSIIECKRLIQHHSNISLDIIQDADHSFFSGDQPQFDLCVKQVVKRLRE